MRNPTKLNITLPNFYTTKLNFTVLFSNFFLVNLCNQNSSKLNRLVNPIWLVMRTVAGNTLPPISVVSHQLLDKLCPRSVYRNRIRNFQYDFRARLHIFTFTIRLRAPWITHRSPRHFPAEKIRRIWSSICIEQSPPI